MLTKGSAMQSFLESATHATQEIIQQAAQEAHAAQNPVLLPLHILNTALKNYFIARQFQSLGIDIPALQKEVTRELEQLPRVSGSQLASDRTLEEFLKKCSELAQEYGDAYVSLEHLMLAWAALPHSLPPTLSTYLKQHGYTQEKVRALITTIRKGKKVTSKTAENQYQALERFCINITKQAQEGKLDPVIGRHEEIRRVIQIHLDI